MKLAIQEHLLAGHTTLERFQHAKTLGLDGVEVKVDAEFDARIGDVADAVAQTGLSVAALNVGHNTLIHPHPDQREAALRLIRQSLSWSVDLDTAGVVFMGHYAPHPVLPDLAPYKSAVELEAELLIRQLSATLCDFALAIGANLLLEHASPADTHLLSRAAYANVVREKLHQHPHLFITANIYHMQAAGDSPAETLPTLRDAVRYVHLSDNMHSLNLDSAETAAIVSALNTMGYAGWVTLEAASAKKDQLSKAVVTLQELLRH